MNDSNELPIHYVSCKMHRTKRTPAVDPSSVAPLLAMWGPKKKAPRKYSSPDMCMMAFRAESESRAIEQAKALWPDASEFECGNRIPGTTTVEFGMPSATEPSNA